MQHREGLRRIGEKVDVILYLTLTSENIIIVTAKVYTLELHSN
jgi:hypothetical protein